MKVYITPTFKIDVTDWYEDERLTLEEKLEKLKDELSDYSTFMPLCDYKTLQTVEVDID